jgi:Putative peptidoglycan binding domain
MRRKRQIVTAALLSGSVAFGAQSIFAQGAPGGGPSGPASPGQTGPTVPQPGPTTPRQTQPTNPGQPAPGTPQTDPMPGQRGTIPERVERPDASGSQGTAAVSSENIKKAQDALKARGLNPGTDGKMDAKTQQALRDFQKANNLPVTGTLDQRTAQQLGVSLEGQSSMPGSAPGGTTTQPGSGSTSKQPGSGGTSTTPRP